VKVTSPTKYTTWHTIVNDGSKGVGIGRGNRSTFSQGIKEFESPRCFQVIHYRVAHSAANSSSNQEGREKGNLERPCRLLFWSVTIVLATVAGTCVLLVQGDMNY
jgi:hypothetical protein